MNVWLCLIAYLVDAISRRRRNVLLKFSQSNNFDAKFAVLLHQFCCKISESPISVCLLYSPKWRDVRRQNFARRPVSYLV